MCTSIMVGARAMVDEITVLARNEDFVRNNWNKYMVFRQRPAYLCDPIPKNGMWTLGNGLTVTIPGKAYSYSAMPDAAGPTEATDAIGDRFFFEERGINAKNVAVSATNSMTINPKAAKADPLLDRAGIAECVIPTLILPQAESAIDGVRLLGTYIEAQGASEVNGVLFGDPDEAWYFENGSGHHWIAVKVPDDGYLVVANGMRVHGVDLDSPDVLCSSDLFEFVVAHELVGRPDRKDFDFAQAFGVLGVPYNEDRIWLAQSILTPSRPQKPREPQYPLFMTPDDPIGVQDVMNVLRATYKGSVLEGKATRPIGYIRTAESHILTFDRSMPAELRGLVWQAVSTPLGAPYMPLFAVMDDIPQGYRLGDNTYGTSSAYWAFRGLFALADMDGGSYLSDVTRRWHTYEEQSVRELSYLRPMLKSIHSQDAGAAIDYAKRYSTGIAYETVGLAKTERDQLMTRITVEEQVEPAAILTA
jgi:dipeptidase